MSRQYPGVSELVRDLSRSISVLKTDHAVQYELLFVCLGQCQFSTKIPRSLSRAEVARASGLLTRGKLYLSFVVGSYIARAYDFLFRIVYRITARRC